MPPKTRSKAAAAANKTTPKIAKSAGAKVTKSTKTAKKAPAKTAKSAKPKTTSKGSKKSDPELSVAEKAKAYHAEVGDISSRLAKEPEQALFGVHIALDRAMELLLAIQ